MERSFADAPGRNHRAYVWQYSRPGAAAEFDFRLGREREGPKRFLGNFDGLLQTDGSAYNHVAGPKMVHAGCWAYARRKFFQAVELNPKDQSAIGIVAQIDEVFKVDRRARERGLTPEARRALRLVNSQLLIEETRSRIEAARAAALPKAFWPRPPITPSACGRD
jgi:transposase